MQITLIGAGFCGSTLAVELLRQGGPDTRVTLVGQPETFGRGVAYGAARPEHLLNVRAKDLGADAAVPSGFADTLALGERGRLDFLPRLAYGEYLQSRLQQAAEAASGLARIEEEAVAVDRVPGGFQVLLANGEDFFSEVVVLAVGALPPQRLAGVGPRLAVDRRYIGWPWQDGAIDTIAPEARLLIVGAGLTMADVAVTLRQRGHRGPITALSRHGLVPQAHLEVPGAPLELPPGVHQALRDHDLRGLVRTLRQLSTVVDDWRRVVDALRPHLQPFWRGLDLATRARFLRHLRSHWETLRHRLAPSVAGQLQAMQAAGQLRVVAGRLLRARVGVGDVEALIRPRGADSAWLGHFDVMIRATGLDTDIERSSHPLVATLRDAGLIGADPLGLGVDADAHLRLRDRFGTPVTGLYCLGPLLRGQLWEITAVPELRAAARDLARRLLSQQAGAGRGAADADGDLREAG
ncbi:hypothetical protein DSC_10270 [Pseudoxanthomonas spadix BD-a59]|uniref:FAD-dependent urate hydroxylase HpyO/Asp monooxygenase CreE-like FAD/NAD(P)-binding domain-containing protein n=1 Tax=Pseudoxanthomonas spadix (strain BD-a59) TaxID=1045855 RepID=G7UNS4_PSEUP|nr:FAD/NAD(P)-binding protein [Pseudoxanthomonas spadix]AER56698.1 hypothetical protein DSC_10270 [Pseudoxanthomonas spadix BD-a59]